jgi:hypothetical protein
MGAAGAAVAAVATVATFAGESHYEVNFGDKLLKVFRLREQLQQWVYRYRTQRSLLRRCVA